MLRGSFWPLNCCKYKVKSSTLSITVQEMEWVKIEDANKYSLKSIKSESTITLSSNSKLMSSGASGLISINPFIKISLKYYACLRISNPCPIQYSTPEDWVLT